jgi:hypothetical protein
MTDTNVRSLREADGRCRRIPTVADRHREWRKWARKQALSVGAESALSGPRSICRQKHCEGIAIIRSRHPRRLLCAKSGRSQTASRIEADGSKRSRSGRVIQRLTIERPFRRRSAGLHAPPSLRRPRSQQLSPPIRRHAGELEARVHSHPQSVALKRKTRAPERKKESNETQPPVASEVIAIAIGCRRCRAATEKLYILGTIATYSHVNY